MSVLKTSALVAILAAALGGCVQSQAHLSPDFGYAVNAAMVAQIADPNARYQGVPDPGSDGARVGLAQERYRTGKTIEPQAEASDIGAVMMGPQAR